MHRMYMVNCSTCDFFNSKGIVGSLYVIVSIAMCAITCEKVLYMVCGFSTNYCQG